MVSTLGDVGDKTASQLGNLKRPENWVNKFEIDKNKNQDPANIQNAEWLNISQGITSITPASNDTTSANSFWNDKGFQETDVTGKKISIAVKGYRVVGDPAQDFIASLFLKMGDTCRTLVRWTDQSGHVIIANCTITKVVTMGGNANAYQTFSFEIDLNGKPVEMDGGTNNDDGTGLNGVADTDGSTNGISAPTSSTTAPTTGTTTPAPTTSTGTTSGTISGVSGATSNPTNGGNVSTSTGTTVTPNPSGTSSVTSNPDTSSTTTSGSGNASTSSSSTSTPATSDTTSSTGSNSASTSTNSDSSTSGTTSTTH